MGLFAHKAIPGFGDDVGIEVSNEMVQLKDAGVKTAKVNDSAITEAKLGNATASGVTKGAIAAQVIATTELEVMLSSAEFDMFAVKAGDVILDIICYVGTAAGSTCTVDIGLDADAAVGSADPNGLIEAADFNAVGIYKTCDTVTDATEPTYVGDLLGEGPVHVAVDGFVTITASHDLDSGAFTGQVVMKYIPA
jgi:hypothetical protein